MKNAGVPVLASVAAILPAMWPDLPMPVTTTRPWLCRQSRQAAAKRESSRSMSAWTAPASVARAARADSSSFESSIGVAAAVLMGVTEAWPGNASAKTVASCQAPAGLPHDDEGCRPALLRSPGLRRRGPATMNPETITELIRAALPGAEIHVESDDNVHFAARIVAPEFAGKRGVARHQMVYRALGDLMGRDIHALSIEALTPEEAAAHG